MFASIGRLRTGLLVGAAMGAALTAISGDASAQSAMNQLCAAAGQGAGCIQPMQRAPTPALSPDAANAAQQMGNALGQALVTKLLAPDSPPPAPAPYTGAPDSGVRFDEMTRRDAADYQHQVEDDLARARVAAKKAECQAQFKVDQDETAFTKLGFDNGTRELEDWDELTTSQRDQIVDSTKSLFGDLLLNGAAAHLDWISSLNPATEKQLENTLDSKFGQHFSDAKPTLYKFLYDLARVKDKRAKLEKYQQFIEFMSLLKERKEDIELGKNLAGDLAGTNNLMERQTHGVDLVVTVFTTLNPEAPWAAFASGTLNAGEIAVPSAAMLLMGFSKSIDDLDSNIQTRLDQLDQETKVLKQDVSALKQAKKDWAKISGGKAVPCLPAHSLPPIPVATADREEPEPDVVTKIPSSGLLPGGNHSF